MPSWPRARRNVCDQKIWTLGRQVGQGLNGTVYVACRRRDCDYAIKRFDKPEDPATHLPVQHEIILSRYAGTKGVGPQVIDAWTCDDKTYMASQFVHGETVSQWKRRGTHDRKWSQRDVVEQVTRTVHRMHEAGILH